MKKKILTILVCASVMLTAACDNSGVSSTSTGSSNESSSTSSTSSTKSSSSTSSESSSSSESSTESSTSTESESSSAPESSTPEVSGAFTHGVWDGNTYTSPLIGLKAEFTDEWTPVEESVLAAQYNGISDMSDANANAALETNAILYELMANTEKALNMNIVVENLNVTNNGNSLTADEYIDLSIEGLRSSFTAQGIEKVEVEKTTVSFIGGSAPCVSSRLESNGQVLYQKLIPLSRDTYMCSVTFTASTEEEIISAMSMFTAI
ncbi:MAG: hypothetical protein NC299_12250 [Lachnospiraceae bacterium]|nr:hypothetical protein [Ruminococcus sp.]MCM1276112.1 hypothetical protein [Lachnospiraceae bacterium]